MTREEIVKAIEYRIEMLRDAGAVYAKNWEAVPYSIRDENDARLDELETLLEWIGD